MLQCDGYECGRRKFHPGCVGFRTKPVVGKEVRTWWFCFECRKGWGKGMKANGVWVEGEEGDGSGGEESGESGKEDREEIEDADEDGGSDKT